MQLALTAIASSFSLALLAAGCSSQTPQDGSLATAASGEPTELASERSTSGEEVSVTDSGFGQNDKYVSLGALAEVGDGLGRFLTAQFNMYDSEGTLVGSADHVEEVTVVNRPVALTVMQHSLSDPSVQINTVKVTMSLSDYGSKTQAEPAIEDSTSNRIRQSEYQAGRFDVELELKNPHPEPLDQVRVGVLCRNKGGEIIGAGSVFPQLIPANGSILETVRPITSGKPTACEAYPAG